MCGCALASALASWHMGRYVRAERGLPRYVNIPALDGVPLADARRHLIKNDTMTWDSCAARDLWPRKLIIKGILHPADAVMAADCGVDAVIVSNHGGIANDAAPAPIEVCLPLSLRQRAAHGDRRQRVPARRRRAQGPRARRRCGHDRPRDALWSSRRGEAGATRALEILDAEIRRTMGAIGCADKSHR